MKEKKQAGEKRYIVTYVDPKTDADTAAQILNVNTGSVANGVALMATDAEIGGSDILHFDGVGSTSITLNEQQAETLKQDNRVLAVEEDVEIFAIGTTDEYQHETETQNEQHPYLQMAEEYYHQGYEKGIAESQRGLIEQLQKLFGGQGNGNGNGHTNGGLAHTAFQPHIEQPFPTPSRSPFQRPVPPQLLPVIQPTPWNIAMVKAPSAWARGLRGNGIRVAVIDTGIAAHADLGVSGGASFVPGIASYNDDNGHGTHCAGIIAGRNNFIGVIGVAPAASLYAVKVLKHNPLTGGASGYTSWVIAGMVWAMQQGIKIVSMSLGSTSSPMLAYKNAIAQLTNAGVSVVCAAGNSFGSSFPWVNAPANSHPLAIAVGAVNINKLIASFSSRGINGAGWNAVTLSAPGVSVKSTYPFPASSYKTLSGTSMACPHVAGAVALIKQKFPLFTPAQIKFKLITSSSDLGVPGNDPTYGAGLLNCDKATL
jgi:subtilisin